jgi:hypothetical protein
MIIIRYNHYYSKLDSHQVVQSYFYIFHPSKISSLFPTSLRAGTGAPHWISLLYLPLVSKGGFLFFSLQVVPSTFLFSCFLLYFIFFFLLILFYFFFFVECFAINADFTTLLKKALLNNNSMVVRCYMAINIIKIILR